MAEGLQVWDAAGNLIFDTSTRSTRLIAIISPGIQPGSQAFPSVNNQIVAVLANVAVSQSSTKTGCLPVVSVSGNTVSWSFALPVEYRMFSTILVLGY